MQTLDQLLERPDQSILDDLLSLRCSTSCTKVFDSLEFHHILDTGLSDDVSLDSSESLGPKTIRKDLVSLLC
jgi:hypothetical protein